MTSAVPYAEVIGDPVALSKSPAIHKYWLKKLGADGDYRATQISRGELASFLQSRRADPQWRGCNVTMPLKLDAVMIADEVSDRAVAAGAANLLLPREGRLVAANTDVVGVARLLGARLAAGRPGGITLLGTGGAARAVLVALRLMAIEAVRIQARDLSEAVRLAVEFRLSEEPRPFAMPVDTEGLINATPLGMSGMAPIMIDIEAMPLGGWVFDMVTAPTATLLIEAAKARGLMTIDGLEMLVEQAGDSFSLLFDKEAPRQFDGELFRRLRL